MYLKTISKQDTIEFQEVWLKLYNSLRLLTKKMLSSWIDSKKI